MRNIWVILIILAILATPVLGAQKPRLTEFGIGNNTIEFGDDITITGTWYSADGIHKVSLWANEEHVETIAFENVQNAEFSFNYIPKLSGKHSLFVSSISSGGLIGVGSEVVVSYGEIDVAIRCEEDEPEWGISDCVDGRKIETQYECNSLNGKWEARPYVTKCDDRIVTELPAPLMFGGFVGLLIVIGIITYVRMPRKYENTNSDI